MTQKVLKEKLRELDRKELEKMICDMYKNYAAAEQFINLALLDDEYMKKLMDQYKEKMYKIENYVTSNDYWQPWCQRDGEGK